MVSFQALVTEWQYRADVSPPSPSRQVLWSEPPTSPPRVFQVCVCIGPLPQKILSIACLPHQEVPSFVIVAASFSGTRIWGYSLIAEPSHHIYCPQNTNGSAGDAVAGGRSVLLHLVEGMELTPSPYGPRVDPFVRVKYCDKEFATSHVRHSPTPFWNEVIVFEENMYSKKVSSAVPGDPLVRGEAEGGRSFVGWQGTQGKLYTPAKQRAAFSFPSVACAGPVFPLGPAICCLMHWAICWAGHPGGLRPQKWESFGQSSY